MSKITQNTLHDKMPITQLQESVRTFAEPVTALLPDARLPEVAHLLLQGLITAESPILTPIARGPAHDAETIRPTSKRFYRFLSNERFSHRTLRKGLYHLTQQVVAAQAPPYLVVAVDPVNFEKPYTRKLEGASQVHKSTPPALNGQARITRGYPAITATIVNLKQPATTYANWFSYTTPDLISANREVERAFRITRALFPEAKLRFVVSITKQAMRAWMIKKSLPKLRACAGSLCCAPVTNATSKCTMRGYSAGKRKSYWSSRRISPLNLNKKFYSRMPAKRVAPASALGGCTFACQKRNRSCGFWLPMILNGSMIWCC